MMALRHDDLTLKWPFRSAKQYIHALQSQFGHRTLLTLLLPNCAYVMTLSQSVLFLDGFGYIFLEKFIFFCMIR